MAKPKYERCEVAAIRGWVEEQLPKLPARKAHDNTPAEFWSRVEQAGLLHKALALYDEIVAERRHTRRETKKQFAQRIKHEGRRAEVQRVKAQLLASGLTQRETQGELVKRFQPQDGTKAKAWETPDPWQQGRLFKKKADQQEVFEQIERDEDDDEGVTEAENRLHWAERRRDERQALADARRRALATKQEPERLEQKARRHVAAQKTTVRPKNDGGGMAPAPKADDRVPMATSALGTRLTATQAPAQPVTAPKAIVPQPSPEPVQKPKRLTPLLCPRCRQHGYANCTACMLATDSSLVLEGGTLCLVRQPTEQDRWPWHRCEHCDNCFKAPQFPVQRICPDCAAKGARR
jgi:hypothetical protein